MKQNNKLPKSISTKFGTANIHNGYYKITSRKEGNCWKLLHRLIYEDYHQVTVLPWCVVHHKDFNKLNNNPDNLVCLTNSEHRRLHMLGEKNPSYGKKGKESFAWKDYPSIKKNGTSDNDKQRYALSKNGNVLKTSIKKKDLIAYAKELGFEKVEVLGKLKDLK